MTKALVTGVRGFCARHLVQRLITEKIEVYGAGILPETPMDFKMDDYFVLDVTDQENVNNVISFLRPDIVFHLAGIVHGQAPDVYQVNFMGSVYLLEAIRKWVPQSRVLLVGSAAEYGYVTENEMPLHETHLCNPVLPYGISKYATSLSAMHYARDYGMKVAIARPFNIIGAGIPNSLVLGAVLARIKNAFQNGDNPVVIPVGNIDTERDFISVEDMAEAYLTIIGCDYWGEVFNICSGNPISIRNLLLGLTENSKRKIEFKVDTSLIRMSDVKSVFGSGEKAKRMLGFTPRVTLASALKEAWDEALGDFN